MLEIYLVRHGRTDWNEKGIIQGQHESKLTKEGIEQAKLLGKRLKDIKFDAIYSSPISRAVETTKNILGESNYKKQEIILRDELKEMGFGIAEGLKIDEIKKKYSKEWDDHYNNPQNYNPIIYQGETFQQLLERCRNFLEEIVKKHKNQQILVVSHEVTIQAFINIINKYELKEFWNGDSIENTSLSIFSYNNDFEIKLLSDVSHLK
ncbi:putative phosphoglycerate mutase [Hypnocyclicus thermotrophus]|uniref:Phosphoglycerate mutase n=1 Tax=Hypnocyclicus thermotrophus TaxID=1627895 RepID=A0AA46E096_9FUSO|nr:histidine phosphatase family protein [Hypnocyclicus thermotrophus]TDT72427.1 putative phosphoglycerate mutase [Hypnocyclicus thermotrophus]